MVPDEITGANFRVYRTTPGFVRCDHPDRADVDVQDAHEALAAVATLSGGEQTPLLVDVRPVRSVSRAARETFGQSKIFSKLALYVESTLSRTLASFFIGVARPSAPTRVFTDLAAAEDWLLE